MSGLSKAFIHERDQKIYAARAAGASPIDIAKKFDVSVATVNTAIRRHISQLNRTAVLDYPEVLALELDRLDKLQRAIWPLTQHRVIELEGGETIQVEPDMKAVDQALRIMQARAKLMGLDVERIQLHTSTEVEPPVPVLAGSEPTPTYADSPENEARELIRLSMEAGILGEAEGKALLESGNIVDAEVVEDDE